MIFQEKPQIALIFVYCHLDETSVAVITTFCELSYWLSIVFCFICIKAGIKFFWYRISMIDDSIVHIAWAILAATICFQSTSVSAGWKYPESTDSFWHPALTHLKFTQNHSSAQINLLGSEVSSPVDIMISRSIPQTPSRSLFNIRSFGTSSMVSFDIHFRLRCGLI